MNKSRKIFFNSLLLLMVGMFLFSSCKKKEDGTTQDEVINQSNEDNSTAETNFDNTQTTADDVSAQFGGSFLRTEEAFQTTEDYQGCAVATFTKNQNGTYTIVVDFKTGCKDPNSGVTRTGKVIINMTARPALPNSVTTVTFDNYTVNGVKVEGTHKTTNQSTVNNATVTPKQLIEVTGAKLTFPDGKNATWVSTRTRTWTKGFPTRDPLDDEFEISGTYSGKNRNDKTYTAEITTALLLKVACWKTGIFKPAKGIITIISGGNTAIVNYGNGDCTNVFTVTINGKTYTIEKK